MREGGRRVEEAIGFPNTDERVSPHEQKHQEA
jgi:hypothetical protein